jgi:hypothetical protein
LSLLFDPGATSLSKIEAAMEQEGYSVDQIVISPGQEGDLDRLELVFGVGSIKNLAPLIDTLRHFDGVRQISSEK